MSRPSGPRFGTGVASRALAERVDAPLLLTYGGGAARTGGDEDVAARAPVTARYPLTAPAPTPGTRTTAEGFEALVGTGEIAGEQGDLFAYSRELEFAAGVDLVEFT